MNTQNLDTEAGARARLLDVVAGLADELRGAGAPHGAVQLGSQFERDLGFDSLARAELLTRVEQAFGVRLPVEAFASALTPEDLLRALSAATALPPGTAAAAEPLAAPTGEMPRSDDAHTLPEALRWHARRHPARTHIVLLDENLAQSSLTYGELQQRAAETAGGLRALGTDPGDTVALMLPTGFDYFVSFIAVLMCGAIPVPIYPPAQLAQLEEHIERHTAILANAQIKVLITFEAVAPVAHALRTRVGALRHVLTPKQIAKAGPGAPVAARADEVALLQYTSGSTGAPKGVMLSHANLLANIRAMGARMQVSASDVLVSWLPLYHDMGLIGAWLAPLYYGVPLVVTSPLTFLARPERWLGMISRYQGSITAAPNFAYERCARHLADQDLAGLDLSSLRFAFCGAEPVSAATLRAFAARLAPYGFDARALTPVYGLAENALGLTFPTPGRGLRTDRISRERLDAAGEAVAAAGDADAIEVPCCGYPLSDTRMRLVDAEGREVPERKVGRIEFRGPSATRGYFRNPDQTGRLFDDGWLDTGDLGYLADGELFVTGRVKDVIIRGGRHFFPYELEGAIARLPGIVPAGVAVCGSADAASATERVVIFAETGETRADARAALLAQIHATTIACFGAPAEEVELVAPRSILKTASGKIRHAATLESFERHGRRLPRAPAPWRQMLDVAAGSVPAVSRRALQALRHAGRGLFCWALVALFAPVVWLAVVGSRDEARSWRITSRACRTLLRLIGLRARLAGSPGAFPAEQVVVAVNHASYLDSLVLMALLPRPVHFVAKRELSAQPLVGPFLRALGTYFVERHDYLASLADEAALEARAREAGSILYFPEGTFTRSAGLAPFHLGAFRAACVAGRPVVPVALRGTRAALRDGEWVPQRGDITVTVLSPIAPDGNDLRAMARLRERVRRAILPHCGEPELLVEAEVGSEAA